MTSLVRVSSSPAFLSLIPSLTGYVPRHSVVLVPFEGSRSSGALRLDIPEDDQVTAFVATAIGLVCRLPQADGVAVVVYADEPLRASPPPYAMLLAAIEDRAHACGLRVVDALRVGPDGWCVGGQGTPQPLSAIPEAPALPGVLAPHADQHAEIALPREDPVRCAEVADLLREMASAMPPETGALIDDPTALFEAVLDSPHPLRAETAAALIWCLDRPLFRDVALVQWASDIRGGHDALTAQLAALDGQSLPERLGSVLLGAGPRPDPDRLRLGLTLSRSCAALAPRPQRAGPLASAAWLSWALGRSTPAHAYVSMALDIDQGHRLAQLLSRIVNAGILPDWAFPAPMERARP